MSRMKDHVIIEVTYNGKVWGAVVDVPFIEELSDHQAASLKETLRAVSARTLRVINSRMKGGAA